MKHNYIFYGTKANTKEVEDFLHHTIKTNELAEKAGKRKTPICIWGEHGIGKTQTVEDYAITNGYKYAYIAPAQFEEMGDLLPQGDSAGGLSRWVQGPPFAVVSGRPWVLRRGDMGSAWRIRREVWGGGCD